MNEFYDKLDELYSAGDQSSIESFLKDAVSSAGDGTPEQAGLLNELAGFYRGISRFAESEEAFCKSLEIFESAEMGATTEYATVLINLAGLFRIKGESNKAIDLFYDAMKRLEEANAIDGYAYISILNNLALALQSTGDYAKALEYATKALDLMRNSSRSNNSFDHEIATSLNNLSAICLNLNRWDDAKKHITEALEIYESMPEDDVHYAAALTTNAVLMSRQGNHKEALDGFKHALELTRRFFGENIEFAFCRRNISEVCELLGDIPSAIDELRDAIRIMDKLLGMDHPSVRSSRAKLEQLETME